MFMAAISVLLILNFAIFVKMEKLIPIKMGNVFAIISLKKLILMANANLASLLDVTVVLLDKIKLVLFVVTKI